MSILLADRVKETSTTTGTGTLDLAGAVTGFQGFVAGIGSGNQCYYCIEDGTNWEVGLGTVTDATPDTLSRDEVLASSNAGAAVNWGAGTRNVFVTAAAKATLTGRVKLKRTSHQTISDATTTTVDWQTEVKDTLGLCDLGAASGKVITETKYRTWDILFHVGWTSAASAVVVQIQQYNSSDTLLSRTIDYHTGAISSISCKGRFDLAPGDYILCRVTHTSGGTRDIDGTTLDDTRVDARVVSP